MVQSSQSSLTVPHSLVQVGDDIFEDLVILPGKATQNVLHRLEALLPIVHLWMAGKERQAGVRGGRKSGKRKRSEESLE